MNQPFENDEVLTEYLLGGLSEDSRAQIEQRFFTDEHFEELLEAMEQELIYAYVQGGLTLVQREKFEKTFLRPAENRQRLEVARVLLDRLSARPGQPVESEALNSRNAPWWRTIVAGSWTKQPLVAVYATAALLLIAAVVWLIWTKSGRTPGPPQVVQHPSQTGSPNSQSPTNHSTNPQMANNPQPPAQGNQGGSSHLAVLAFALEPGETRDSGAPRQLMLSPQTQSVSIQLRLHLKPDEEYATYQATVLNPDEKTVWSKVNLHPSQSPSGPAILLTVPAQVLSPDDYKITLSGQPGSGTYQGIADYYFSVRQR